MKPRAWFVYTPHDPREPGVVRYVGWTVNVEKRLYQHLSKAGLRRDRTRCGHWKRSILKAGVSPVLEVLIEGNGPLWGLVEVECIAYFRSVVGNLLTNHAMGGEGFTGKHSAATKAKMSASQKGKKHSEETKAKISATHMGMKSSPEAREKMRRACLGRIVSPETRAKLSQAARRLGADPKVRAKRSLDQRKIATTPEERAKRRERLKRQWADPDFRAKRIAAQKAAQATPEEKARKSEASRRVHQRRREAS